MPTNNPLSQGAALAPDFTLPNSERLAQLSSELIHEVELAKTHFQNQEQQLWVHLEEEKMTLEKEFDQRLQILEREKEGLELEKERMMQIPVKEHDVITLNVRGIGWIWIER